MHTFPPRQWRAMKLIWSGYRQKHISPQAQIGAAVSCAPTVSRWERTFASGRIVAQGSTGEQRRLRCSKPESSGWAACSPLLHHQGGSLECLAACSKSFADFSQEHFSSNFEDTTICRLGPVSCLTASLQLNTDQSQLHHDFTQQERGQRMRGSQELCGWISVTETSFQKGA